MRVLTPRDILQAEFKRVWKGYSPEEVDEFLRRVVAEYEAVYKENQALREKVQALEEKVARYASSEAQISVTLEVAKQAAADVKAAAAKEAEATLQRARAEAEGIVARARRAAASEAQKLLEAKARLERFRERAGGLLHEFLEEMERWEVDVPSALEEVAAGSDSGAILAGDRGDEAGEGDERE